MDGGRLKPLDTFARSLLTQFSGKDHYGKKNASTWLAALLFNPDSTANDKVFLINNPDIAIALGMPIDPHRRYSPADVKKVYPKLAELQVQAAAIPDKERSLVENEIMRVFNNINQYADLSRAFAFVSQGDVSPDLWNVKDIAFLTIPIGHDNQWLSPWDAVRINLMTDATRPLVMLWKDMAASYSKGDAIKFELDSHTYLNVVAQQLSAEDTRNFNKFSLELQYHAYSPFTVGIMFYILAFMFFLVSFSSSKRLWYYLGLGCVIAGFVPHTLGLIARIIIMARPPVSNLYETFIFVGFVAVILGLFIEFNNRQWLGIVTAAISGAAMLFIANKYSAEGDTLKMLIAVLNSNFWLATHVTTITMGYGATCVAGVLGHVWLLQAAAGRPQDVLDRTYRTTLGILGFSLTLTFLGTNLGGVWADQSWGRFWGWDPKENGALMIVLWVAILLHAKVARMIDALGMAVGCVVGMLIVMWAWFGVNLLSVGLHSYGFTQGVATTLIVYAVLELVFIAVTAWVITGRRSSQTL